MKTINLTAGETVGARRPFRLRSMVKLPSISTVLLIILAINIVVDVMMRRHAPRLPVAERGHVRVAGTDPNS
ncbi:MULTISPECIES: hypothetical protein [Rhodopseudomonas]|uniref:Uncharacterized protein n=1 Tax=Rhodopseudomonas palustris TaxID=1076 RepID=A0A0D7EDP9_RHOPL|nr:MULTISPECIES: hypothetical protein [Rhodopseudomonas]KIZ38650.1 hypothetical protein OO17_22635 [Rhodopseudomonas palustris]MDF3814412.1 hypothetical protein [Rhodopseudomonas sp. BAL398]WOK17108.1 hypothetical protein RBJ75_23760 [Rhodopseudomonas sp. BAL398]